MEGDHRQAPEKKNPPKRVGLVLVFVQLCSQFVAHQGFLRFFFISSFLFLAALIFAFVSGDKVLRRFASAIRFRCSSENLRPTFAVTIRSLASGDRIFVACDSRILMRVSPDAFRPVWLATIFDRCSSLKVRPLRLVLIAAWCSGDFLRPLCADDIFDRASSLCLIPSWLPATGQQLKP